jgi:hypothetical protein
MELPNQNFNLKQREMFAKLLAQAKTTVEAEMVNDYQINEQVKDGLLPKLAEEHGATELIAKIQKLRNECDEAETALAKIGFEVDADGDLTLKYRAPAVLRKALESAKNAARKERDKALKKYDQAILGVWASQDAQEAKKIVEGLL